MWKQLFWSLCAAWLGCAAPAAEMLLIPTPQSLEWRAGELRPGAAGVEIGFEAGEAGHELYSVLRELGVPAAVVNGAGQVRVRPMALPPGAYLLEVAPEGLTLAGDVHAAAATLAQLRREGGAFPACRVVDAPLYAHRGLLLDEARSPLGAEEVRRVLRLMARYKLNRLHWHLTDDQGWRVEIRSYPRLTQVGGSRAESPRPESRYEGDGRPLRAFYTQQEMRELVDYAHRLGITIIPEFEIPGHATAILAAYPELGNTDIPGYRAPEVSCKWGVHRTVLAPKEETLRFIEQVLDELCELFPHAETIGIGGDEVPRSEWEQSPAVQQFMRERGMTRAAEVQDFFTRRAAAMLEARGRRALCWDEVLESDSLPDNVQCLVWRGTPAARLAEQKGVPVILCPRSHFYFDYPQGHAPRNGQYNGFPAKGVFPWQKLLRYDPAQYPNAVGVQGNAWGEAIQSPAKLEYMLLPRLCALAEVAWAPAETRPSEADFRRRIEAQYPAWDAAGLNFREEDGTPRRDRAAAAAQGPAEEDNPHAFDMTAGEEEPAGSAR